jgi:hypothetical protein
VAESVKDTWFKACLGSPSIGRSAGRLRVLGAIFVHMDELGYAWPSRDTMAAITHAWPQDVSKVLGELCKSNALRTLRFSELPPETLARVRRGGPRAQAYQANFEWAEIENLRSRLSAQPKKQRSASPRPLKVGKTTTFKKPDGFRETASNVGVISTFKGRGYPDTEYKVEPLEEKNPAQIEDSAADLVHAAPFPGRVSVMPASRASALESQAHSGNSYARAKVGF